MHARLVSVKGSSGRLTSLNSRIASGIILSKRFTSMAKALASETGDNKAIHTASTDRKVWLDTHKKDGVVCKRPGKYVLVV